MVTVHEHHHSAWCILPSDPWTWTSHLDLLYLAPTQALPIIRNCRPARIIRP